MVQLKATPSDEEGDWQVNFNSLMVQLKDLAASNTNRSELNFNSLMVQLKVEVPAAVEQL